MDTSEKLKDQIKSYLKEMNEKEMRLALQALNQEKKRRKSRKKK